MNKKIPILGMALTGLLFTAPRAMADEAVGLFNVEFTNGETITFTVDQTPRITYSDSTVTVTYTDGTLTYGMADITRLTLPVAGSETAIDNLPAAKAIGQISCVGGAFRFEGFPAGSRVQLFNMSGQLRQVYTLSSEGNGEASLSEMPAGNYVITVQGQTYKFNKR
jgi:hypothetical protein